VRPLELDDYLPADAAPMPVAVFLHGAAGDSAAEPTVGPFTQLSRSPFEQGASIGGYDSSARRSCSSSAGNMT
jgi:hypothetical protein